MDTKILKLKDKLEKNPSTNIFFKRKSAVLIPIIKDQNGNYSLIFEKRVERPMRHSGEISFPGGVLENDETPIETALRETQEEIGIDPREIEVLGYLKPTKTKSSGFLIIPVVGYIKNEPTIKVNPDEVEKVLVIPIVELIKKKKKMILGPYYKIGETVIWGATARILTDFLEIWKNI